MAHPNEARALRTARNSGYPVAKMGALPPAERQKLLDGLNSGALALITTPNGQQFITPLPAPEAP